MADDSWSFGDKRVLCRSVFTVSIIDCTDKTHRTLLRLTRANVRNGGKGREWQLTSKLGSY